MGQRFYGSMTGGRGQMVTKAGSKNTGLEGHIRGWEVGAKVSIRENENGDDEVFVYATSGSNASSSDRLIARYTQADLAKIADLPRNMKVGIGGLHLG